MHALGYINPFWGVVESCIL